MSSSRSLSFAKLVLPTIALLISAIVFVVGLQMTLSGISDLSAGLESQQATVAQVYVGQSSIGIASAVLASGIIGFIISLVAFALLVGLGGLHKDVVVIEDEFVEEFDEDFADDEFDGIQAPAAAAPAVPVAEVPVVEAASAESPAETAPVEPKSEGDRPAN